MHWKFQYENFSFAAIREGGGAFAKLEIAREEEYFYKKVNVNLMVASDMMCSSRCA